MALCWFVNFIIVEYICGKLISLNLAVFIMWIDFSVFNILKSSWRDLELKTDEMNYIGQHFLSEAGELFTSLSSEINHDYKMFLWVKLQQFGVLHGFIFFDFCLLEVEKIV